MMSAKLGNYWYYFYNVFGMTRSFGLNPGPPVLDALDASTLPLGYRGGDCWIQLRDIAFIQD